MRRAEAQARLGHAATRRRAHGERDAEVGHHGAPVVQQDVLRLHIAVHDAARVCIVQGVGYVARDAHGIVHTKLRFAIELGPKRFAVDERHHVEQKSVGRAAVEQRQNMRMLQRGGGLDLLHEPLGAEHGGQFRLEQLERHLALVLEIFAQIHRGHAAFAKVAENAVAAGEGGVEAVGVVAHRCTPKRLTICYFLALNSVTPSFLAADISA